MEPHTKRAMSTADGHAAMPRRIAAFRPYSGDTSSSSSSASSTTRGRRRFRRRPRPEPMAMLSATLSATRFVRCESAPSMRSGDWLSDEISEVAIVVKSRMSKSVTGLRHESVHSTANNQLASAHDGTRRHNNIHNDDSSVSSMSSLGDMSYCAAERSDGVLVQTFECLDIRTERLQRIRGMENDTCAKNR